MSKGKPTLHLTLYTAAIILFLLFLFNPYIVSYWVALHQNPKDADSSGAMGNFIWPDSPGTFGDSFGALTSLFSFASFALLIYAFIREREDAIDQKALLREQLVEAKVTNFTENLPFFIATPKDSDVMQIRNAGADAYAVTVVIVDDAGYPLAKDRDPHWESGKNVLIQLIASSSKIANITLYFSIKSGEELRESFLIKRFQLHQLAHSPTQKHIEVYRNIVRGRMKRLD